MKKVKKLSLSLNKEVIDQLDKIEGRNIVGGSDYGFLTIWGSNCYNTNPLEHNCCTGTPTTDPGACWSYNSNHCTESPLTCN